MVGRLPSSLNGISLPVLCLGHSLLSLHTTFLYNAIILLIFIIRQLNTSRRQRLFWGSLTLRSTLLVTAICYCTYDPRMSLWLISSRHSTSLMGPNEMEWNSHVAMGTPNEFLVSEIPLIYDILRKTNQGVWFAPKEWVSQIFSVLTRARGRYHACVRAGESRNQSIKGPTYDRSRDEEEHQHE